MPPGSLSNASAEVVDSDEDGPRVLNVSTAYPYSWPWQVSLQSDGVHYCSGTLISHDWVLAPKHCYCKWATRINLAILVLLLVPFGSSHLQSGLPTLETVEKWAWLRAKIKAPFHVFFFSAGKTGMWWLWVFMTSRSCPPRLSQWQKSSTFKEVLASHRRLTSVWSVWTLLFDLVETHTEQAIFFSFHCSCWMTCLLCSFCIVL